MPMTSLSLEAGHKGLDRRTVQLTEAMASSRDKGGNCNISHCIEAWSYDVMVRVCKGDHRQLALERRCRAILYSVIQLDW